MSNYSVDKFEEQYLAPLVKALMKTAISAERWQEIDQIPATDVLKWLETWDSTTSIQPQ